MDGDMSMAIHDSVEMSKLMLGRLKKGEGVDRIAADIMRLRPSVQFFVLTNISEKYPDVASVIGKMINDPSIDIDVEATVAYIINELKERQLGGYVKEIEAALQVVESGKEYATIVFLQNSDDFDDFKGGAEGFFDASDKEKAKYLSQWDYGDYDDVSSKKPWGSGDTVVKVNVSGAGKYILTYNDSLEYAGLVMEM